MVVVVECPRCGSGRVRRLEADLYECLGEVPIGGAPGGSIGLPHPVMTFGPCGNRWRPSAIVAERQAQAQREQEAREGRARAREEQQRKYERALEMLRTGRTPGEVLRAFSAHPGSFPESALREAWLRLLEGGTSAPGEELLTLEGRSTAAGYLLSRGTFASQWGSWKEIGREPAFRAKAAGQDGADLWLDRGGALWSTGAPAAAAETRIAIGPGGHPTTERFVVEAGAAPSLHRGKARHIGWETTVLGARSAYRVESDDRAYTSALRAVLIRGLVR